MQWWWWCIRWPWPSHPSVQQAGHSQPFRLSSWWPRFGQPWLGVMYGPNGSCGFFISLFNMQFYPCMSFSYHMLICLLGFWGAWPPTSFQCAEARLRLWSLHGTLPLWDLNMHHLTDFRFTFHISTCWVLTKIYTTAYCRRKEEADTPFSLIDGRAWLRFLFCLICKRMGFIISSIALSCLVASLPLDSQSKLAPQHLPGPLIQQPFNPMW